MKLRTQALGLAAAVAAGCAAGCAGLLDLDEPASGTADAGSDGTIADSPSADVPIDVGSPGHDATPDTPSAVDGNVPPPDAAPDANGDSGADASDATAADAGAPDANDSGTDAGDAGSIVCTSTPTLLVTASETQVPAGEGFGVAVDRNYIYWGTAGNGTINRRSLLPGQVSTLVSGLTYLGHIAVDSTYVYWADVHGGDFAKASNDGGAAQPLSSGYVEPTAISLNGGTAYLSVGKTMNVGVSPGEVLAFNLQTTGVTTVAANFGTGQPYPYDVAVAANGNIYWVNEGGNSVDYVTTPGGTVNTLTAATAPTGLVSDGDILYWTNVTGGTITKYDLDTSISSTPFTGLGNPHGIALDSACLYWARADTGEIWTALKP